MHSLRAFTGNRASSGARRLAVWTVLAVCLTGDLTGDLSAQTALVLATDRPAGEAADRLAVVRERLSWPHGPVVMFTPGAGADLDAEWRAALAGSPLRDAAAVIVVAVAADRTASLDWLESRALDSAGGEGPRVHVAGGVSIDAPALVITSAVERSAYALLAAWPGRTGQPESAAMVYALDRINVTATRAARDVFTTPVPVTVIGGAALRDQSAASAADAFRYVPGLDVEGVGPGRQLPVIRGFRGQRVVLLGDGLRLNQPRRRVDSGEPTALVGWMDLERVEIVRGPSSVLYGSDAIGGVVNLVSRRAPVGSTTGPQASAFAGYGSAGRSARAGAEAGGVAGPLGYRIAVSARNAGDYDAPAGRFGDIDLADPNRVRDSGIEEFTIRGETRLQLDRRHELFARHESYRANDGGYGFFDAVYGPAESTVRITVPRQDVDRTSVGWRAQGIRSALLDRAELTVYAQDNDREFVTRVHSPLPSPPGTELDITTSNITSLATLGVRAEASKLAQGMFVTWGFELVRNESTNADTSRTVIAPPGTDPVISGRGGSQVPDATLLDIGLFAQSEFDIGPRLHAIVGVRYQETQAKALETRGYDEPLADERDRTLVGSANLLFRAGAGLNIVGGLSRGFRSPNLIERFFAGNTPEGRGFWERNDELGPETSFNLEVGARYRSAAVQAEAFLFRNALSDGIVLEPTGEMIGRRTVYRNVNVDRLRYRGAEVAAAVRLVDGLSLAGSFTALDVADLRDPDRVFAETYPLKLTGSIRYDDAAGRFWGSWTMRHTGSTGDPLPGTSAVGDRLPAFTVHDANAGVRISSRYRLGADIRNLTNRLYAEALNVGVFRPEPARSFSVSLLVEF